MFSWLWNAIKRRPTRWMWNGAYFLIVGALLKLLLLGWLTDAGILNERSILVPLSLLGGLSAVIVAIILLLWADRRESAASRNQARK